MEYYINDFTEKNYQRLLQIAMFNNRICNFEEALNVEKGIILRHDIDFSVHRALALSKIEKMEGVQSTYFVHLHSLFYNAMEKEITDILKEIIYNGGLIGLHFDPAYYELEATNGELLNRKILIERNILEQLLDTKINCLSFHNPDVGGAWHKIDDIRLGGMINVYARYFRENFEYCSDSNGYWRFKRLEDVLLDSGDKKIQVLTHPVWWQKEPMYPYERIRRCAESRAANNLKLYSDLLEQLGRENVGRA